MIAGYQSVTVSGHCPQLHKYEFAYMRKRLPVLSAGVLVI